MMRILYAGLLASLLLLCLACTPRPLGSGDTNVVPPRDERLIEGRLDNGLRYRLLPTDQQPGRLDIRLRVDAGSIDERAGQAGVAHLLEHLVFYNRDRHGVDVRQRLQQAGWQQGRHFNALTNPERTLYMLSPPAGNDDTRLALQMLAQLVFQQDFSATDLEHERPVVIEEWRGGLGVAQRMNDQRRDSQRVGSGYAGSSPIGGETAIRQATVEQLKAFHQSWYAPNNMQLNIVGDFEVAELLEQIQLWLAAPAARSLPERDLDLPLMPGVKSFRLQDSESGSRQVSLLFRGHHAANRVDSLDGQRERLLDRIATRMLLTQLQRQPVPAGVRAFSMQRAQLGLHSEVLALAASLERDVHEQALQALLTELQRIRHFGLYQADLDQQLDKLRQIAHNMLERGDERDFTEWVQLLHDPSQADAGIQKRSTIARNSLILLQDIRLDDINRRLVRWTDTADLVLQLSSPDSESLALPDEAGYQALLASIDTAALAPPQPLVTPADDTLVEVPSLPAAARAGSIDKVVHHTAEQVEYWTLSNGDRLVWLRQAHEDGKARLQIETRRGYRHAGSRDWLEQTASQLVWNSPPQGFDEAQWQAWQQREKLPLRLDQQATHSSFTAETDSARLASLFALYRTRISLPQVAEQTLEQARVDLKRQRIRQRPTVRQQQDRALAQLRFGPQPDSLPQPAELERLEQQDLLRAWNVQMAAPVTYYLLADIEPEQLQEWVMRELAGIARQATTSTEPLLQRPGLHVQRLASAIEPRASLQLFSFSERDWTPEDAVRVASLRQLASQALKERLRTEARGLYQLTFDSELNPRNGRLESRLLFSSDPQRLEELWQQAREVLTHLPEQLDEQQVQRLRRELLWQERERLRDDAVQLHRLVLSDQRWGDPRYLSDQHQLPEALEITALRELAGQLLSPDNQVSMRLLPRPSAAR